MALSHIYNCWNCEGPGISNGGSRYICPRCDVLWLPVAGVRSVLPDRVYYSGSVVIAVDFNDPAALSSPA
jgi:hypothetical protein